MCLDPLLFIYLPWPAEIQKLNKGQKPVLGLIFIVE